MHAQVNIVCLEDEQNMLEYLCRQVKEAVLDQHAADAVNTLEGTVRSNVQGTDNLADALDWVTLGKCDIILLDFMVKSTTDSTAELVNCWPILRKIREKNAFIPMIAHTAFEDELLELARSRGIAVDTVNKKDPNSTSKVVEKCKKVNDMITSYKLGLVEALATLAEVRDLPSTAIAERQDGIVAARRILADLHIPPTAPFDYKRAIATLRPVLMRVSSIASPQLGIRTPCEKFLQVVAQLGEHLLTPTFSFSEHGLPAFHKLEQLGYCVFMRQKDDESKTDFPGGH